MCRWLIYFGNEILLKEILFNGENSIIKQSYKKTFTPFLEEPNKRDHEINADGFGIGWYSKNIEFIHYYNNVIVFKKKSIEKFPVNIRSKGETTINKDKRHKVSKLKLFLSIIISFINKVLGYLRIKPLFIGSTSQRL